MLPDLHTGFSRGRSGGLVFLFLSEFSTVYCDPHKDFGIVNRAEIDVFLELYMVPLKTNKQTGRWLSGKEFTCQCRRRGFDPWVGSVPWRRKWLPTAVFLPGISHGQRRLMGYSSWSHKRVRHDLVTKQQNSHNIYCISCLKCTIYWFLVHSHCCTTINTVYSRIFSSPDKEIPCLLSSHSVLWLLATTSLRSASVDLLLVAMSYKWDLIVCSLLWLAIFTLYSLFNVCPCCSIHQYFIPFLTE